MSESKNVNIGGGGVTLLGLLTLLFVGLKLGEVGAVASWPWLWILSPLWGPLALGAAVCVLVLIFYGVAKVVR